MEVKIHAEPINTEEKKKEGYDEWELECKARTLLEAEEIKQDSKLMEALKPYLEKKAKAISSIAELKEVARKKAAKA